MNQFHFIILNIIILIYYKLWNVNSKPQVTPIAYKNQAIDSIEIKWTCSYGLIEREKSVKETRGFFDYCNIIYFFLKNYNLILMGTIDMQIPKILLKSWINPKFLKSFNGENRPHLSVCGSTPSCWSNVSKILSGNCRDWVWALFLRDEWIQAQQVQYNKFIESG